MITLIEKVKDGTVRTHELNNTDELYLLYNDWIMDVDDNPHEYTEEQKETIEEIREWHTEVFEKFDGKTYPLEYFEMLAMTHLGH